MGAPQREPPDIDIVCDHAHHGRDRVLAQKRLLKGLKHLLLLEEVRCVVKRRRSDEEEDFNYPRSEREQRGNKNRAEKFIL